MYRLQCAIISLPVGETPAWTYFHMKKNEKNGEKNQKTRIQELLLTAEMSSLWRPPSIVYSFESELTQCSQPRLCDFSARSLILHTVI